MKVCASCPSRLEDKGNGSTHVQIESLYYPIYRLNFLFPYRCLFFSPCSGEPIDSGLLYYLKTNDMYTIPAIADEWRGLMLQRNLIAHHLKAVPAILPSLLKDQRTCTACPQLRTCMALHKVSDSSMVRISLE